MPSINRQRGFSVAEIMIAVAVIGLMVNSLGTGLTSTLSFQARQVTQNKLSAWRNGISSFYLVNAMSIETDANAELNTGAIIVPPANPNAVTKQCNITAANIADIATRSGYASGDLRVDGYNHSFCMLISPRMSQVISGVTIYYHSIAIVSPGKNGVVEASTTMDANGNLLIDTTKDDVGVLFDGRQFAQNNYNLTLANLQRTSSAYTAYYAARYQSDLARNLATDYFSCGSATCVAAVAGWDAAGSMLSTCATGPISMVPAAGITPYTVLGLSQTDVSNAWGTPFMMDNCSNSIRSPGNATASMQVAPYTAQIYTTIPGGSTLTITSVGQI